MYEKLQASPYFRAKFETGILKKTFQLIAQCSFSLYNVPSPSGQVSLSLSPPQLKKTVVGRSAAPLDLLIPNPSLPDKVSHAAGKVH